MWVSKKKYENMEHRAKNAETNLIKANLIAHTKLLTAELRIEELELEVDKARYHNSKNKGLQEAYNARTEQLEQDIYEFTSKNLQLGRDYETTSEEDTQGCSDTKSNDHWSGRHGPHSDLD